MTSLQQVARMPNNREARPRLLIQIMLRRWRLF
jgi:hypothetical protein